ncbi:unnamed protein product [Lasius platythorax]|uniref:Uncharacterized protein n=1 Tax=Lasius platythorax TaxID=488582 RepID=A0AAV2N5G8_9HYME
MTREKERFGLICVSIDVCYVPNVYPCHCDTRKRYNTPWQEKKGGRNVYTKSTSIYQIYGTHNSVRHLTSCTYSSARILLRNIIHMHTHTYTCCNTKYETLARDPECPRFDERERDIRISLFAILYRKRKRKKNRHLPNKTHCCEINYARVLSRDITVVVMIICRRLPYKHDYRYKLLSLNF